MKDSKQTCHALASAWFWSRNNALSTSRREIAWSRRVRPSVSVSLTLAPPPSSCSAISSWLPAHRATPSTEWPAESFSVRFGMTWRLRPLCVTWAKHTMQPQTFTFTLGQHGEANWNINKKIEYRWLVVGFNRNVQWLLLINKKWVQTAEY